MARSKTPLTASGWQSALGGRVAHIQSTKVVKDCTDYCQGFIVGSNRTLRKPGSQAVTEDDSGFEEYGTTAKKAQGTRPDLTEMFDNIDAGMSLHDLMYLMPGTTNGALRSAERYQAESINRKGKASRLSEYEDVVWKPWQQDILDIIDTKPDGRTCHWFYDTDGNIGKSYLTTYLMCIDKAYCPAVAKAADIYCGYTNFEPVIIFDIPRSKLEFSDHIYPVIEDFINGRIFSPKYQSTAKVFAKPHVIVFSNEPPKYENDKGHKTLSADRWNVHNLSEKYKSLEKRSRCDAPYCTNPNCRCKSGSFSYKKP